MEAIRTNQRHPTDHTTEFMAVVRELVVQQLSINTADNSELDNLCACIENRLVINLSSTYLTPAQLSLLQLGVGFRPNLPCDNPNEDAIDSAADSIVENIGHALLSTMNEQCYLQSVPTPLVRRIDTSQDDNPKRELHSCFSNVFKRLLPAIRSESNNILSEIDVVSGRQLKRLKDRLLRELPNADGNVQRNLSTAQLAALRQLNRLVSNRTIIIRKADKSRQLCILDPAKYDQMIMAQLSDTHNYLPIPFNMNYKCAALIKQCVGKFLKNELLSSNQAHALLLHTNKPATRYFYGLPKTHKPATKWTNGMPPLRPICPDLRTETTATGCFIAQYLKPLLNSIKSYCKNSYTLKDRLLDIPRLGSETVLLTSDVDSLYPSIPIGPALHRVVRKLNNKAPEFQLVVQLLGIQLAHNYFAFQDKSFHQIRGLPMGKAWAPVVACIYMEEWECSLWNVLGFEPVMYVRYIDDIFAVFNNRADADRFVQAAATHDPNIKLSDTNVGKSVHFLDLQISINDGGRFETSLYRKESDLIVLLHHKSAHTRGVKDGVVLSQLCRFLRLHTNYVEAGRCMYTFMRLMVRLRGLSSRRARSLWSTFLKKIRSGSISIGRQLDSEHRDRLAQCNSTMRRGRLIRIPVPPTLRWKRMRLVLDNFLSQLNAQQRAGLRNIVLYNSTPPPLGVTLFRR